jgi:hypothetical protein
MVKESPSKMPDYGTYRVLYQYAKMQVEFMVQYNRVSASSYYSKFLLA